MLSEQDSEQINQNNDVTLRVQLRERVIIPGGLLGNASLHVSREVGMFEASNNDFHLLKIDKALTPAKRLISTIREAFIIHEELRRDEKTTGPMFLKKIELCRFQKFEKFFVFLRPRGAKKCQSKIKIYLSRPHVAIDSSG